jgi:hypothetical protein
MSISNDIRGDSVVLFLESESRADTTACTSAWIDCSSYKGNLIFIVSVGAVTGSIVGKLRTATSDAGAGAADITGATHASFTTADHVATIVVPATVGKYIQYVGTVVTGPVLLSVTMLAHPASAG